MPSAENFGVKKKNGMKTLKDFIIWCIIKDVVPFLLAFHKQVEFYADLGMEIF